MAMSNFRDVDRRTAFLLPPSVDEWLPERHLARFVVEVIDGLDLGGMIGAYRGSGSAAHHPRMLLGVLVYGYATGVFSSRKLERATYDSVAFRYIAANDHPDHDTIATFRRRFLKEIEGLFVRVLLLAREMGVLKMGTVGLDGTKIHQRQRSQRAFLGAREQARGAIESRGGGFAGARRGGGRGRCSRRHVNSRRAGLAREASGQARGGAGEDRGAGERAIRARAGRARGQTRRARGQDRHDRQEARRQAACAARRRAAAEGSDQPH